MYLSKLDVIQTDAHGVANSMFMLYYVFGYSLTNIGGGHLTACSCGSEGAS